MPIDYQVLEEGGLVLTVFSGHVTTQEVIEHTRDFMGDTRIRPGHRELADLSRATSTEVSFESLADAVKMERDANCFRDARLAIVAPQDIQYGMSRMYLTLADKTPRAEVELFRDVEQARSWLGLTSSEP